MSERSELISRLRESLELRTSYIKSKIGTLVPSQIRALRLQSEMPRQADLAQAAGLHQSRISMFETPGAANMTLETLARLAAAFKVGLIVRFVSMNEMLRWENEFSQDQFKVTALEWDSEFLNSGYNQPGRALPFGTGSAAAMSSAGNWQEWGENANQAALLETNSQAADRGKYQRRSQGAAA